MSYGKEDRQMSSILGCLGASVTSKRDDKKIGKFDSRVDEGILVGYSCKRKAYKCYNLRLNKIVESINVKVDEMNVLKTKKESENSNIPEELEGVELKQEE